jgi:hypothetical protein
MLRDLDESAAREFFVQNEEDHKDIAQRFPDLLQTGKPSEEG